jgi:RNA polymerase sigma factor (sigma-70 family)
MTRDELINSCIDLPKKVAKKHFMKNQPGNYEKYDELVSVGNEALCTCADKFVARKKAKTYIFSAYASISIYNAMVNYLKHESMVKSYVDIRAEFLEERSSILNPEDIMSDKEENQEKRILLGELQLVLPLLTDDERQIIDWYYGFNEEPKTQLEIAELTGYSNQGISYKIKGILDKLKSYMS